MQQLNNIYVKWNWLLLRERAWRIWGWLGSRYQPQIRMMRTAWGDRRLETAIRQAQSDKELSAGWWEVGWRKQSIIWRAYLSSPPNYKQPKGSDLTTKPQYLPKRKMGCRGGEGWDCNFLPPSKHLNHKLWGPHFKCNIPGISFCLWSFLSASPGMAQLRLGCKNAKCWERLCFFNPAFYSSWVQNQILNSIPKWGRHQVVLGTLMSVLNWLRSLVYLGMAVFAPTKMAKQIRNISKN